MEAVKSLFGGNQKVDTPEIKPPAPIPDPESATARLAATKTLRARAKRGREGTIYSQGGSYGGTNLAGTV